MMLCNAPLQNAKLCTRRIKSPNIRCHLHKHIPLDIVTDIVPTKPVNISTNVNDNTTNNMPVDSDEITNMKVDDDKNLNMQVDTTFTCYICLEEGDVNTDAKITCSKKTCIIKSHLECARKLIRPKCPYCASDIKFGLLTAKDIKDINTRNNKYNTELIDEVSDQLMVNLEFDALINLLFRRRFNFVSISNRNNRNQIFVMDDD